MKIIIREGFGETNYLASNFTGYYWTSDKSKASTFCNYDTAETALNNSTFKYMSGIRVVDQ